MKYWTSLQGSIPSIHEPTALASLPGFTLTTLVCPGTGEISEGHWRRAGEFNEIVCALEAQTSQIHPTPPSNAPPPINGADDLLDAASTRLFSHVADLMKELETRRDEKSLISSLQNQISTLQRSIAARESQLNELQMTFERTRRDLEASTIRIQQTENDLGVRTHLTDALSRDLAKKEFSLAKALCVIQRLEEELKRLCPDPSLPLPEFKTAVPPRANTAFTNDDPPPPPPYLEPPPLIEHHLPQQALMSLLRKVFPGKNE